MAKVWHVNVNWNGDGATYVDEANTGHLRGFMSRRGRLNWLLSNGSGFQRVMTGELQLTMEDSARRFDPYNASSPLYAYLSSAASKKVVVTMVDGATYNVFFGRIDNLYPDISSGVRRTIIHAIEGQKVLSGAYSSTLQANIRIDAAISSILSAISWPDGSAIDSISDFLPYWGGGGASALDELYKLTDCGLGKMFIAEDGRLKVYSRLRTPAVTETLTGNQVQLDIGSLMPWDVVKNSISVVTNGLVKQSAVEIFRDGSIPGINAGATSTIWVSYTYNNIPVNALNVITPVPTTDFLVNTLADGTGTDLTASCSVVLTAFSGTAKYQLTNGSGSSGFAILRRLRGDALVPYASSVNVQDPTSIGKYFEQDLTINNLWQQNGNIANDLSNALLTLMKDAQQYPQVKLRNQTALQFTPDLFDWITVTIADMNINNTFALGYVEHNWLDEIGQTIETQFRMEPTLVPATTYWKFPASLGINTTFAF